jgi:predicted DNA binding CopG/RHH family protein
MGKVRLDREEVELLDSYEAGEWRRIEGWESEAKRYEEYAQGTFKKDRRVNIRISSRDLEEIQKRALEEGIPYQTLIGSILHKYVSGRLVERRETGEGRARFEQAVRRVAETKPEGYDLP